MDVSARLVFLIFAVSVGICQAFFTGNEEQAEGLDHYHHYGCYSGWHRYRHSCYKLSQDTESWVDAAIVCEETGGYLAKIETAGENEFLKRLARSGRANFYWIGGHDLVQDRHFQWIENHPRMIFTDWAHGEPSRSNQHCMALWKSRNYSWDNYGCVHANPYICEKKI